jgi:Ca2+-binding RTX toxin-like protein
LILAQVLGPVGGGSNNGEVVTLADGGYMAVWTHLVSSLFPIPGVTDVLATAVLGRVFNADGTPRGEVFQVNQSNENSGQGQPEIALLSNGNLAVVWTDGPSLVDFDVSARGRIITATGAAVTDEFQLSSVTARDQRIPQVVANDSGGFFASWSDGRSPWSNTREQWIGQEFDSTGARIGPELWLRDDSRSEDSELVSLGNGNYAVIATQGRITGTDASFLFSNPLRSSTNNSNYDMPGYTETFGYEDDAAGDGNGHVVTARPNGGFGVTLSFLAPYTAPNIQAGGSFSDGTPYADTLMYLGDDPRSVSSGATVNLGWTGFGVRPDGVTFTPSSTFYPSVATTFMPNGNIAVVWTGVSGGTATVPQFSVYAQIVSAQGIILSDIVVIEDQNVQGTDIAPPFVSAGANGQLFIGWTGTTARNGAGTNEVMGGVFDVPTYDLTTITPSGAFATDGDDVVTGYPFTFTDPGLHNLYLMGGNDTWYQGEGYGTVYGMGGDDHFVFSDTVAGGADAVPGLGRDTFDYSLWSEGRELPRPANLTSGNAAFAAEIVIGTLFNDTATAQGGSGDESLLLHTEAGDDTIQFYSGSGSITVDGGDVVYVMTSYNNRADWQLDFHGDHYTLGFINYDGTIDPERNITVRAVESIVFADETVVLQATASVASGGAGSAGGIVMPGGGGSTPITGTANADVLIGTSASEVINGLGGDDIIAPGIGSDTIDGGDGIDRLSLRALPDTAGRLPAQMRVSIDLTAGVVNTSGPDVYSISNIENAFGTDFADQIIGNAGNNALYGFAGNDVISGLDGEDEVAGGDGDDVVAGGNGNDRVFGDSGNDTLYLGFGNDIGAGGAGNDIIYGGADQNTIWGGLGDDTVLGGSGVDIIYGGGDGSNRLLGNDGADQIYTGSGGDYVEGGAGNDMIRGGDGVDTIFGGAGDNNVGGGGGDDILRMAEGNDTVYGGLGNDNIGGGAGNDLIIDGAGNNIIWGGAGADSVYGGTGSDTIYGGGNGANVLLGDAGNDIIHGGDGNDFIGGGTGNDEIYGGVGGDTIYAGTGNDFVGGGAGNDLIFGSAGDNRVYLGLGDDRFVAGTGKDVVTGGPGADVFEFHSAAQIGIGSSRDVITDFTTGVDKIDLSLLSTQFNGTGGLLAGGASSFFYYAAGGLLIGDADGNGTADWVLELGGAPAVAATDFIL